VIPASAWAAVCSDGASPDGEPVFALDVNPERSAGAIVAASTGVAELVEYRHTTGWMVGRAQELSERWGAPRWVVDSTGPAGSLIADLERAGLVVHPASARDLVVACGSFYDGVLERRIRIRRHARFDEAAAGCPSRQACLDYAQEERIDHGLWGGKTAQQRRALRAKAQTAACPASGFAEPAEDALLRPGGR
jgi:hypothetical protein